MDTEKLFAIDLADNEKKTRDLALRKIKNYIRTKALSTTGPNGFTESDMVKIWKGLHYSMWMCDKMVTQQDLSEKVASIVFNFNDNDEQTLLYIRVYFMTIMREWIGIDKWRMDKFLMQMRAMLNQSFAYLKYKKWNQNLVKQFLKILSDYPLNINSDDCPDGVCYHLADIYIEELAKFGDSLTKLKATRMLNVFCECLAKCNKRPFVYHLSERFFNGIIDCSDIGLTDEIEEEMENIKAYGLQAGEHEDPTDLTLQFDYNKLADTLFKVANKPYCLKRNRKTIYDLVKKFRALAKGIFPTDFNLPNLNEYGSIDEEAKQKKKGKKATVTNGKNKKKLTKKPIKKSSKKT